MPLVPVDFDPFADAPGPAPASAARVGSRLVPVDHNPFADEGEPSMIGDVVQGAGAGLIKGAATLPDTVQNLAGLADAATAWPARQLAHLIRDKLMGGQTASDRGIDISRFSAGPSLPKLKDLPRAGEAMLEAFEGATGKLYEPKTTAGKYARTAAEFVPGAGRGVSSVLSVGILPGLASEGAGQALEGTEYEGAGRAAAGLITGGSAAAFHARPAGNPILRRGLEGLTQEQIEGAAGRMRTAREADGIDLPWDEALNAETKGGAPLMSQLARNVANRPGGEALVRLYAERPAQVEASGRRALDAIAPATENPSAAGLQIQDAARSGLLQTPEGRELVSAQSAAGPRMTAGQAGEVIQPSLQGVFARAFKAREEQAARDYAAARDAPERSALDRTVTVERPGEPLLRTLDAGPPRPPVYDAPPEGPPTIGSLAPQRPENPAQGPTGPTLSRFIAEGGGMKLERGDLRAADLDRWNQPGVGHLVRQDGHSIDGHWRPNLIESGYLPPDRDGGAARNIQDELIRLLEGERRGQKARPYSWAGSDEATGFGRLRDEHQDAASRAMASVRQALTDGGIDPASVPKEALDRAAAMLMRGDEADAGQAFERSVMAAREPRQRYTSEEIPTTVTEEISAPLWGQVDPHGALAAIDEQLRTAKGDVRSALQRMRRDLDGAELDPVTGDRLPDQTVAGQLHARERADYAIADAKAKGDGTKVRDLTIGRQGIDAGLKAVPEVAIADANFARNSGPLTPFAGDLPLGRIVARDDLTGRSRMPAREVVSTLRDPGTAREFMAIAPAKARNAFEQQLTTRILDEVTDATTQTPSAGKLRAAMRDNEDLLRQAPGTVRSLERVLAARDAFKRVEATPTGQLALQRPGVREAVATLFPHGPNPGGAGEIASAVKSLYRNDRRAGDAVMRGHLEFAFNDAIASTSHGTPAQYGGAAFHSVLRGNPERARHLEAAVRAMPDGDARWAGLERYLDTVAATGWRPAKGSDTAFNQAFKEQLDHGEPVSKALTNVFAGAVAGGAAGGPGGALAGATLAARKAVSEAHIARQSEAQVRELARMLTDPALLPDLKAMVKAKPGTETAAYFARRLSAAAQAGREPGEAKAGTVR